MVDIANSAWSVTDASNTSASPNGWPSGTLPNQVEPNNRQMMGATKRWWERSGPAITSTGSSNAYVYTPTNTSYPTAYVTGDVYVFKSNFANSSAATLNVNGLGAKNIFKQSTSGPIALTGSEIQNNQVVVVMYDGTQFQIVSVIPVGLAGAAFLAVQQSFTAGQAVTPVSVSSSGNVTALDFSISSNFSTTLTQNTTIANPTNILAGESGQITITQASGPYTVAFGNFWKFSGGTAPTVSTVNGAKGILSYYADTTTSIISSYISAVF